MKSKKFYISAAILAAASFGAYSATLSPEEALARVTQRGIMKVSGTQVNQPELVYTQADANSEAACYVFDYNNGQGFMVVSADDLVPALLGYSDDGRFDETQIPEPMKYWLESYASQIEWAREHQTTAPMKAVERPQRSAIAPLITTKWNQSAPFNNKCPQVSGTRCVTGCVATAMAQAMKYHNWPEQGEKSYSYTWNNTTLSMDFSTVTFDWDNMLDTYGSDATDAQKDAVATLMYACGISVDMRYGTGASAAVQSKIATALYTYFGYSKGVYSARREYYGLIDWENLIYENLRDCGPVVYGGQSNDGGHSFICDGYSRNGYFHINWGWGGMSDGYFLLTALNPTVQGIGGSTSGYNFSQDAIIGIKKPGENDDYHYTMGSSEDLTLESESVSLNQPVTINTGVFNYSPVTFSGSLGMRIESLSTDNVIYATSVNFNELPPYYGYKTFRFYLPSNIPEGEYRITPVFKTTDGDWQDVSFPTGCSRYLKMTVEGTTATFSAIPNATVTVTEITPQTKIYLGREFCLSATITNPSESEYLGEMTGVLIDTNNKIVGIGDAFPIDLLAGETVEIQYLSSFTAFTGASNVAAKNGTPQKRALAAGNYQLAFVKGELDNTSSADADAHTYLSDKVDVQVEADPGTATLTVKNLRFTDGNSSTVNAYQMNMTAEVSCTSGYASAPLTLYIFPGTGGTSVGSLTSEPVFLSAGESKEVTFKGRFSNGDPGATYFCEVYYNGNWISNQVTFTLADVFTGLDNTLLDKQVSSVNVYTLNGMSVSETTDNLPAGIYVVVTTYNDGSVNTSKLIKR